MMARKTRTIPLGFVSAQPERPLFDLIGYTGNGAVRVISPLDNVPNLILIKDRSSADRPVWFDTRHEATKYLFSSHSDAVATDANSLTAFGSGLFSLGNGSGIPKVNTNLENFIAWCWEASTANGFQIISYTGNGASGRTLAHALGVAPEFIIIKRADATAANWNVYCKHIAATAPATFYTVPNNTAQRAVSATRWNDTEPSASVITFGNNSDVNGNTIIYTAYVFAPVAGKSAFGRYVGTGAAQTIALSFDPRFVLIKRTEAAGEWTIYDTVRGAGKRLRNAAQIEDTQAQGVTAFSGGFSLGTLAEVNALSGEFMYAAFA